jgi:hypothetical protein
MNKVSGLRRHTPVSTFKLSENGARAGQAMVEFLLVAPLFFFLIFAVFDFGRLFLVEMEVENAVYALTELEFLAVLTLIRG